MNTEDSITVDDIKNEIHRRLEKSSRKNIHHAMDTGYEFAYHSLLQWIREMEG